MVEITSRPTLPGGPSAGDYVWAVRVSQGSARLYQLPLSQLSGGSGTAGVATFNGRAGTVTLTLSDVTGITGTGATARSNLGLATVASSGAYADLSGAPTIPTASSSTPVANGSASAGTSANFARADHVHPTDTSRLGASAIPAAAGQLLGGSGTPGASSAVTIGTGLSLSGGTLSATGTGSTSPATTSSLGVVKIGAGLNIDGAGLLSAAVLPVAGIVIDGTTIAATPTSPYQLAAADRVVVLNKTTGAASQVTLPVSPLLWVEYVVIDGKGDAGTNTITIAAPPSSTIDGQTSFVANANGDRISFRAINTTTWFTT